MRARNALVQGGLDGDTRALRKIFRTLRDSVDAPGSALGFSGRPHELEGVFRQLVNPEAFRRIVTLGLSEEERGGVPKTFQVRVMISVIISIRVSVSFALRLGLG